MNLYASLPAPPTDCTAVNVMIRLIDAMGFRYQLATSDLGEELADFRPVEGSMNMRALHNHMYKVLLFAFQAFQPQWSVNKELYSLKDYREVTLEMLKSFSEHLKGINDEELAAAQVYLKRVDTHYPFWYLINGPLSDVLTHIGQINSWRRMAGHPVERVSPFTGEKY